MKIVRATLLLIMLLPFGSAHAESSLEHTPLRIGVTPVFLNYQTAFLNDWKHYLKQRLNRPVIFIQRTTYREITDLLLDEHLDFAWICGYPYMRLKSQLRLAAVPTYQGKPLYQSYLIVPKSDTETRSIAQLKDKVFAYSDPDSNSGYLVPQYQLVQLGERREGFFRKSFFTWAHEKVVEAVASGVANGGAVDGYIWETLNKLNPELTTQTRIVEKSEPFGFPPLVARLGISEREFQQVQMELFKMNQNPDGKALLARLNLDGFSPESDGLYASIRRMIKTLAEE